MGIGGGEQPTGSSSVLRDLAAVGARHHDGASTLGRLLDLDASETSPGRYRVAVDEAWTVVHLHGGVLAALAARMAEHSRPDEAMRVTGMHALYLRPLAAGTVVGVVSWLRTGRGAAQASVDLAGPDGALAVRVAVVLAAPRAGDVGIPSRPPPSGASDVAASTTSLGPVLPPTADTLPFQRQHDWLRATPQISGAEAPPEEGPPAEGPPVAARRTFDTWFRLHETPVAADGGIEPLVPCLAADAIGPAATEALGLWGDERVLVLPTLSMDLQILAGPSSPWLLQHAEIHHLAGGLVLGTVHLYDEDDELVAVSSQRAAVRFF